MMTGMMGGAKNAVQRQDQTRLDQTFGRARRLGQPAEFKAVFLHKPQKQPRNPLRGDCFHLYFFPNGAASARFGVVVAKKLARLSVWRNAIKRAGRESFRLSRPKLPAHDLVLRLVKPVKGDDKQQRRAWRAEIERLLADLPGAAA